MEAPAHLYVASNDLRSAGERPEFRFPNGLWYYYYVCVMILIYVLCVSSWRVVPRLLTVYF